MTFIGKLILFGARDLTEQRAMMARLAVSDRLASVGTLATGVAHEINNPIAFVQTSLSLLAEELPALFDRPELARLGRAQVDELLRDAMEGVARIRSVVRDLQSMARTSEGRSRSSGGRKRPPAGGPASVRCRRGTLIQRRRKNAHLHELIVSGSG